MNRSAIGRVSLRCIVVLAQVHSASLNRLAFEISFASTECPTGIFVPVFKDWVLSSGVKLPQSDMLKIIQKNQRERRRT